MTTQVDVDLNTTVAPTEYEGQVTWSLAVAMVMAVIACVGAVGNILIIGAVFLERRLRVRGNAFIVNLAIADLIVTAYIMPIGIATSQYRLKPFSDHLCDFNAFIFITTCGVSTQSLMLIAIERYIHVCKLAWYEKVFRKQLVVMYILFAWIYTMIWAMQGWTGWTYYYYGHDYYLCLFYGPQSFSYDICLSVFGIALPIIVLVFCYVNIFKRVKKSKNAVASHGVNSPGMEAKLRRRQIRDYHFIMMLVVIVVVFCVCWAPGACVMALSGALGPDGVPVLAYTVTIWVALCNSAMNSTIYGIMNMNFRRGYASIVRRLFCCSCCSDGRSQCRSCDATSRDESSNSNTRVASGDTYKSSSKNSDIDTMTEFSTLPYDKPKKRKHLKAQSLQVPEKQSTERGKEVGKETKPSTELSKGRSMLNAVPQRAPMAGTEQDNPAFVTENNPIPSSSSVKYNWQSGAVVREGKEKPLKKRNNQIAMDVTKIGSSVKGNWEQPVKSSRDNKNRNVGTKTTQVKGRVLTAKSTSVKGNWQTPVKY